jgi:hypothetical protein
MLGQHQRYLAANPSPIPRPLPVTMATLADRSISNSDLAIYATRISARDLRL